MTAPVVVSFSLVADATPAPGAAAQPQPPAIITYMPLIFVGIMFYFLMIRPQQKRAKEQQSLIASVRSGDEVVTSGGLHGIVSNARDAESKTVLVKFAENVKIEVDKSAITAVIRATAAAESARGATPAITSGKAG